MARVGWLVSFWPAGRRLSPLSWVHCQRARVFVVARCCHLAYPVPSQTSPNSLSRLQFPTAPWRVRSTRTREMVHRLKGSVLNCNYKRVTYAWQVRKTLPPRLPVPSSPGGHVEAAQLPTAATQAEQLRGRGIARCDRALSHHDEELTEPQLRCLSQVSRKRDRKK
ncbi:hypothetical protein P171DRAFT_29801 [Karstenula rhodostoma CBS 690.94]|uniref:Uncharacterized protein n=1 Tax=Karstenula rhodostoma CBS 690.94 TaxID=1392251 RepID=A0A9P4PFU3_9PLEO|nr:hypothetical protein P171DRAFT_29801 [Karstenula rhodostoma CBS 690.94]